MTIFDKVRMEEGVDGQVRFVGRDILEEVGYHHMGITRYCENIPQRYVGVSQVGSNVKPYVVLNLEGALLMLDNLQPSKEIVEMKLWLIYYAMPVAAMNIKTRAFVTSLVSKAGVDALQEVRL